MSLRRTENTYVCVQRPGQGLLKIAAPQINIQAPIRFSTEEQGVMGDAVKTSSGVQRWKEERRGGEKSAQNNTGEK